LQFQGRTQENRLHRDGTLRVGSRPANSGELCRQGTARPSAPRNRRGGSTVLKTPDCSVDLGYSELFALREDPSEGASFA
jgi:hypothetical protein